MFRLISVMHEDEREVVIEVLAVTSRSVEDGAYRFQLEYATPDRRRAGLQAPSLLAEYLRIAASTLANPVGELTPDLERLIRARDVVATMKDELQRLRRVAGTGHPDGEGFVPVGGWSRRFSRAEAGGTTAIA